MDNAGTRRAVAPGANRKSWPALAAMAVLAPLFAAIVPAEAATATIVEYPVPDVSRPSAIVKGPDANMWFTDPFSGNVDRVTSAGVVTKFAVGGHPTGITVGPDANLWFIEAQDKLVGRMSTDGTVLNQFAVPWLSYPQGPIEGITLGPDNHVWITDPGAGRIGWIGTNGAITSYKVGGVPLRPHGRT